MHSTLKLCTLHYTNKSICSTICIDMIFPKLSTCSDLCWIMYNLIFGESAFNVARAFLLTACHIIIYLVPALHMFQIISMAENLTMCTSAVQQFSCTDNGTIYTIGTSFRKGCQSCTCEVSV